MDPYALLGVARDADEKAIRSAYRALAKKHHPDLNPGKPEAEAKFKEIAAAYALLSDAEKRARFDRGEIDATGAETAPRGPAGGGSYYRQYAGDGGHARYSAGAEDFGGFDHDDLESLLRRAFNQGGGPGSTRAGGFPLKGQDAHYSLTVDFLTAARGATRRLTLPDGQVLDVTIPAGLKDGQALRLAGKGGPGVNGGPHGDAFVEVAVSPHPLYRRDGDDIIIELPVTLKEAVLGAKVKVPTIHGSVMLAIPPRSSSGTRLRLKGRGIRAGHQVVELKVVLPPGEEPELAAFLEGWKPRHDADPRAGLADLDREGA
ncbi:DnaJ C-terminal domain-containing protein [Nitrospirillum amazonense]|uniref:DnaJ C-terminal domain-containing protein n=1 Tax=Nitrospirillum amazonense TaxID=28077 RepID=UPI002412E3A5|nr:DnaJ C-terminal domain-containing protein [Nitrospirillum amazonense]MDG3443053.1 DnaJ C-terminal domain-containing protein [Nitrospirillum amazonense]